MAGFLDLSGLKRFKSKLLEAISATHYTKAEVNALVQGGSGGADAAELCEQLIAFRNGYTGESLDYRDYLGNQSSEYLNQFYAFGTAYLGATNG